MNTMKKLYGFSLVELMIAMTISLVLMLGVATIMINTKRTYNVQQDKTQVQENARFAMEFLNKHLRMSGYFGCSGTVPTNITPLQGQDNISRANLVTDLYPSDVILVSFIDSEQAAFSVLHESPAPLNASPLQAGQKVFTFTNRGELFPNDQVIASDCGGSDRYEVESIDDTSNQVTLKTSLVRTYSNGNQSYGAQLGRLVTYRYFVAATDDGFSLFRDKDKNASNSSLKFNDPLDTNSENVEELIQGVENMQIRYGVDTDSDGAINQYQTSTQVNNNWNNVISVRITLLVNTIKERLDQEEDTGTYVLDPNLTYNSNGAPIDHRRRIIFTTTVMLRNNSTTM
ncbi:MAG: hypothetical protein DRQ49_16375 [Gammaproteobacteria bacterium]|nr:MAG: hypothetical protein DRQ49_16375 [Gammaproteobacteria bacterium]RKZ38241.1 MAG: hypothetical protein DRQ41_12360 [Gammaproteobacteria bacterium]RKZ74805.1 MAG: hypothetical protein DRQ57_09715 [Gammaproteobacteria bacterium]